MYSLYHATFDPEVRALTASDSFSVFSLTTSFSQQVNKMPLGLFGNKFSPKKTPPRRAQSLSNLHLDASESKQEFGLDYGAVKVSLGGNEVAFENGLWVNETGGGGASYKEVTKLRKANHTLHEENNLLKLKIDILLDMLAETSAVSHFHENEVKQLREAKLVAKKR